MDKPTADFRHWMRDFAHRLGLPAFWQWWTGQIAPLVPAAPRLAVQRRLLRPVLAFGPDFAVLWRPRTQGAALAYLESARIPLHGDPAAALHAGRAAIEALPRVAYGTGPAIAKVVVALPPGQVLRKQLTLPLAVAQDLKQALAYDLDRHTPFKADELHFDAAVVARDTQKGVIKVDWAAALRTAVAEARRRAESWGATVVCVTPDSPGSAGPQTMGVSRLNLLPESERPATDWWRRWRLWVPMAAVALVAMIAVLLPIWQKRGYVIALSQITNQAKVQADAASALREQLETVTGDYNYVLGKKYAFPSAVQVLDDVTKVLPDDTWITSLEVKSAPKGKEPRRELLLRGESNNAGRLVSLLEDSKIFIEAAPRSPTTKIQPGPGEIFDLGALVRPVPPPPPLQIANLTTEAATPAVPGAARAAPVTPGAAPVAPVTPASAPAAPVTPAAVLGAPAAATFDSAAAGAGSPVPAMTASPVPTQVISLRPDPGPSPPTFGPPPPGMMVPRDLPPPPGSVAPPSASAPPTMTVDGQQVISPAIPSSPPQGSGAQ